MKRLGFIIAILILFVSGAFACEHTAMQIKADSNGKLYGYCSLCGADNIDLSKWKQETDFGLSIVDPYLDVEADMCDIGNVKTYVSSGNSIYKLWVISDKSKEILDYEDLSSSPSSGVEVSLPQTEGITAVTLVAEVIKTEVEGSETKENHYTAVSHFSYKPFHSIKSLTITEKPNADSLGIKNPSNVIRWYIENPDDEDIMSSDVFNIYRSKTPDFLEYNSIGSISFSEIVRKDTLSNGTEIGWMEFEDTDEEGQYNTDLTGTGEVLASGASSLLNSDDLNELEKTVLKGFYTHGDQKVYYIICRALAIGMWTDHRGQFIIADSVNVSSMLPSVSEVKVEQNDNWSSNKNVTLKVKLKNPYPWEYNTLIDNDDTKKTIQAAGLDYRRYRWDENAKIVINRYSPDADHNTDGSDAAAKTLTISGSDVTWVDSLGCYVAETYDCQSLPYTHYYYDAYVIQNSASYPLSNVNDTINTTESEANASYSKTAALIGNMAATKGTLLGKVNVHWTLGTGSVDALTLERREYTKEGTNSWEKVNISADDNEYEDEDVRPGHVEEYRLTATFTYRKNTYTSQETAMGYPSYYGKIAGHVVMPNGVGIADAKVVVTRNKTINIEEVRDDEGNIIMEGAFEGVIANAKSSKMSVEEVVEPIDRDNTTFKEIVYTDESGAFEFDSLLFSTGDVNTAYAIEVGYGNCEFLYNGSHLDSLYLSNSKPEYDDVVLTCNTYHKISGIAYYKNSTVPVRDAYFILHWNGNEYVIKDKKGDKIVSDVSGNFSLLVPDNQISVQIAKDGHTFDLDGYIPDNDDNTTFLLTENVTGKKIYDTTKTKLVGRLCGGNVEARKPLGFGRSKNNLGDNLTIVLQLEGDNSSSLYYDIQHTDLTQQDSVYTHPYNGLYGDYQGKTKVSVQRKRIVIHPDSITGEFMLDVFPTKYKVTQLSAEGYSSLYLSGEGFDVIDFSDSTHVRTIVNELNHQESILASGTYVKAYHKPATITYEQYKYGQKTGFLGDETITELSLSGKAATATIASYDSSTGKANYLFGYPVFTTGNKYTLQIRAHEDYYYNNDEKTGTLDEVHFDGGKLHVQNGLLSNSEKQELDLDSLGMATIVFTAGNTTFSQTEDNALRSMNISVELNDFYYEAEPLRGFVTGYRDKNTDVVAYDSDLTLLDILHDPYGANSYAWLEKGATYTWNKKWYLDLSLNIKFEISSGINTNNFIGVWSGVGAGAVTGTTINTTTKTTIPLSIPTGFAFGYKRQGEYTYTLNERVQTSSDPYDIGSMADVYIGTVHTSTVNTAETFSVIDEDTYKAVEGAVQRGTVRIVKSGVDNDGNKFYLAIAEKIHLTKDNSLREFIYSQRYILGTLIPNLIDQRSNLLIYKSESEVKNLAKEGKTVLYWSKVPYTDENYGLKGYYEMINESGGTAVDEVANINSALLKWTSFIMYNDSMKAAHINDTEDVKRYSVAGGAVIDESEKYTSYYNHDITAQALFGLLSGTSYNRTGSSASGSQDVSFDFSGIIKSLKNLYNHVDGDQVSAQQNLDNASSQYSLLLNLVKNSKNVSDVDVLNSGTAPAFSWDFDWHWDPELSYDFTNNRTTHYTAGRGYHIASNDNSYFDMDVVRVKQETAAAEYLKMGGGFDSYLPGFMSGGLEWTTNGYDADGQDETYSDHIFYLRGGAVQSPYFTCDSTIIWKKDGQYVALGTSPMKIDNPKIYIDKPIVSNVPEDEKATFTIRISNDTDLSSNVEGLNPTASTFTLMVKSSTNPNGAKVTMDGVSLNLGWTFKLQPGQSMTKTIQVERGVGYDYKDLTLVMMDPYYSLESTANLSVNYLPMATNVNIASPTDKWVMNTYSATDEDGRYYIPVNIDGFNVNSDGFHHIELQYKKQTEGDSQWVTVGSFYNDSTLYAQATGTKEMIPSSGKISNVKFYGESDPMEMKYDLRAVSFRALGTGFTTRASSVMSGMKDTRCPEVFGMPKPTNGILTYEDVISIPFNEPIAYNYLNETSNFQVVGYLNDSKNTYQTALHFDYEDIDMGEVDYNDSVAYQKYMQEYISFLSDHSRYPVSKIKRNLTGSDFTLDMMVKLANRDNPASLAMINDSTVLKNSSINDSYFSFNYEGNRLYACFNGVTFSSGDISGIDITSALTHIGVAVANLDENPQVKFFVAGQQIETESIIGVNHTDVTNSLKKVTGNVKGQIKLGLILGGDMADVKLWSKALSLTEFIEKKSARLSKNEANLLAYWPMDEGSGNVLYDKINGCNLYFSKQTWNVTGGQHSLKLNDASLAMTEAGAAKFTSTSTTDYTMSFWFNAKEVASANDTISLMSLGDKKDGNYFAVGFDNESMLLTSAQNTYKIAERANVVGNGWHHVAIVANHSQNTAAIFIDGQISNTLTGTSLAGISGAQGKFGSKGFVGNIDNLTFWSLAYPSNCISNIYTMAPSGMEMGLDVYLPFEHNEISSTGSQLSTFTMTNMAYNRAGEDAGQWDGEFVLDETKMIDIADVSSIDDEDTYCPIHPATDLTNIDFSWTATDNELQVNIKKPDWEINHQNIYVTVRNVEDLQGNVLANPQMMTVYVNKNVLEWEDAKLDIPVSYGNEGKAYLTWKNKSGHKLSYTLEENYSWLTLSETSGTADPLSSDYIEATISDGLAPGNYEATIYLVDENELSSPVTLNVTVTTDEPEWEVASSKDYCYTMNVMGKVKVTNDGGVEFFDTDTKDIVGVFYGNTCVGKSYIKVNEELGTSYVYLTVYGNKEMANANTPLEFKLWRASTNKTCYLTPQVTDNSVKFVRNGSAGCPPDDPIIFRESDEILQSISLDAGWNWISLNIKPKNETGLNSLFDGENSFTQGDQIIFTDNNSTRSVSSWIKGTDDEYQWNGRNASECNNLWHGVYQIYVQNPLTIVVHGYAIDDDSRYVTLTPSADGRWNELAYLLDVDQPVEVAMSDYSSDRAKVGTIIKSLTQFAVMDASGKWLGSLEYMHPGEGYFTKFISDNSNAQNIYYSNTEVSGNAKKSPVFNVDDEAAQEKSVQHATSMPVIASSADEFKEGDVIIAYANGEVVGVAEPTPLDDGSKRFFISLNAEEGSHVYFAHLSDGEVVGKSKDAITYDSDVVAGTLDIPYNIDFSDTDIDGDVYSIAGFKYGNKDSIKYRKGVFIIGNKKIFK